MPPSRIGTLTVVLFTIISSVHLQKLAGIAAQDGLPVCGGEFQCIDCSNRIPDKAMTFLGVERRVRREDGMPRTEEVVAASQSAQLTVHGRIGVKKFEILHRRLLETVGLRKRIDIVRSEKDLAESQFYFAGEERNHAPHVMGDDLDVRILVEQA